jgi:DNA-binding transcriptional MerR regulator
MPTTTGAKETWRDWFPDAPEPDRLFTRDEVLEFAARDGTKVTTSNIRYWEALGIIPRPIRRWHGDAVHAVYPIWVANLLRQVRTFQREGYNLRQIKHHIRTLARLRYAYAQQDPEADDRHARLAAAELSGRPGPEPESMIPELITAIEHQANLDASSTGVPTDRVEVHVIRVDGTATRYPLPIAPYIDPDPAT